MAITVADTIKEITTHHLMENDGLLFGQCITAVGWIGGTVPDLPKGLVEIPMTDVAGPAFACGAALMGRRPIFIVRYQGFMWYNASSIVNYAGKSKAIWNQPCPIFIRSIAMEGFGIGHTASSANHSIFMHMPGIPVASPMTPNEYRSVWNWFCAHDDPVYVSEHRRSFTITEEFTDQSSSKAYITIFAISAGRLNALEAVNILQSEGIHCNIFHIVWLKPFKPSEQSILALINSRFGMVVDSDFEIAGASQSIAYDLMHLTGTTVYALGLEDRSSGVAENLENITPSVAKIVEYVKQKSVDYKLT